MLRNKRVYLRLMVCVLCAFGVSFASSSLAAPPPAPTFMPGFPMLAAGQAIVMWTPIPSAKEYKVYRNGAVVSTTPGVQFFDALGDTAGEYKYQVSAVGQDGVEGPKSAEKVIRIVTLKVPDGLTIRRIEKTVAIRWNSVPGAAIYNIYRAEKDVPAEYKLLTSATGDSFRDTDVKLGKTYFYKVSAKDLSGKESALSAAATVKMEEIKAAEAEKTLVRRAKTVKVFKNGLDFASGHLVDLRAPADVAITKDKVFISSTASKRVSAFDRATGAHLFDIGSKGVIPVTEKGFGFAALSPIRLHPDGGSLYVTDYQDKVVYVFNTDGGLIESFQPEQPKPPDKPTYVGRFDVDSEGNVWAVDTVNKKVRIYGRNGKELRTVGDGSGITNPGFCRIDAKRNRFYLADSRSNDKIGIAVYDLDGKFIKFFGEKGVTPGKFWAPSGFDVRADGNLIEADGILAMINVIDPNAGKVLYGLIDEDGKRVVQINGARGLQVDGDKIYVASGIIDEVELLEMTGEPYVR